MALPRLVAEKLSNPVATVLQQLSRLSFPGGFGLSAPGDASSSYGTVLPVRRNFKPFIVGLLPPDVPVDFVAFRRAGATLTGIDNLPQTPVSPANRVTDRALTTERAQVGNDGKVSRVRQNAEIGEIRRQVYDSYVKYARTPPSDATINLITAQMIAERGRAGDAVPTWNFNFGNSHAGGTPGTYSPGLSTLDERKSLGREGGPTTGIDREPTEPSGGTYYLSTDFDGKNNAYPVYFTGFSSLQQGVDYQVNLLMRRYPGAASASTVDEFTDGLLNGAGGFKYFEAPPASYLSLMNRCYNTLTNDVDRGKFGGQIGGSPRPPAPAITTEDTRASPNTRFIMSSGSSTQLEPDPSGDRIGKFVESDPDRERIGRLQADALRAEIEAIQGVPGLLMLVNPSEFSRAYIPSVDNSVKGRQGNIVHVWLEKPMSVTGSGVTAGQYVIGPDGNGGLANQLRVFSASYQNLLSLLTIYKTNGIICSGPEVRGDSRIRQLGYSVFIYYDNHIYVGSFDSFEIQDSELKPHNMSYSFKFNVRYDMDVGNDGRFTDFEVGVNNGFFPRALPA